MFSKNKFFRRTVVCSKCNGHKLLPRQIQIFKICDKCNGFGELDWIENITRPRNDPGMAFKHTVDLRNSQLLAAEIKKIMKDNGLDVVVSVRNINSKGIEQNEIMRV